MSTTPRRALLVIDVQNEYFTGNMLIEYPSVDISLPNIVTAMAGARAAGVPVIVVQHDAPENSPVFAKGSEGWQLHPLVAAFPAEHRINKTMSSAFAGTNLRAWLDSHGIDTLTVSGYMTHNCDAASIYQAAHEGLQVELLQDASGAVPYANAGGTASAEEIHRVFSTVFHSNFAAVVSTQDWLAAVREGKPLEKDNIYLSNQRARTAPAS
ncbi:MULTISPECIES: cysteine hydrolase family protein [unclassified Janthinobacterium]|uniref:cysteine hydrolase family protein n=1 Tax=unclassified Janthinobacterium TaxID=2610881 RepID=UPI0018CA0263|nr:cysteine hydrolase family protein [Janthinobacterium sp. CG_23.4]MDH6158584.1 nicotinamidase-related amidase [Janthinobacterium sp. CG_23.4]